MHNLAVLIELWARRNPPNGHHQNGGLRRMENLYLPETQVFCASNPPYDSKLRIHSNDTECKNAFLNLGLIYL